MAFNALEEGVGYYMAVLIAGGVSNVTDEGWILHEYVGYSTKVQCLERLSELRFGERLDRDGLEDLIQRLRLAGRKRNEITHATWYGNPASDELTAAKYFRKPRRQPSTQDVSGSDLKAAVEFIERLDQTLISYMGSQLNPMPWLDEDRPNETT